MLRRKENLNPSEKFHLLHPYKLSTHTLNIHLHYYKKGIKNRDIWIYAPFEIIYRTCMKKKKEEKSQKCKVIHEELVTSYK